MKQSPSWEANRFAASQEIPHILWNPQVHNRFHKCPPPVSIMSQIIIVHTPTSHFLKIRLNTNLPSTPGSPQWPLFLRFSHQNPVHAFPLSHTHHMHHPSHYSRFHRPHNIGWGAQIIKLLITKFSLLPCYLVYLRSKYSPHHSIPETQSIIKCTPNKSRNYIAFFKPL
jgi:hypothetical protein